MLALPAEPGRLRQRLLHDGSGIDEDLDVGAAARGEQTGDALQLALDDVVIVASPRIERDRRLVWLGEHGERIAFAGIVHAEHDDGADLAPELARIGALRLPLRHPVHLALIAMGEPGFEALRRPRDRIGRGDAHHREALSERPCFNGALEFLAVQKSRLS